MLGRGVLLVGRWVGQMLAVCALWIRSGVAAAWGGERVGDGFGALARWTEDGSRWVGRMLGRAGRWLRDRGEVEGQEHDMV